MLLLIFSVDVKSIIVKKIKLIIKNIIIQIIIDDEIKTFYLKQIHLNNWINVMKYIENYLLKYINVIKLFFLLIARLLS